VGGAGAAIWAVFGDMTWMEEMRWDGTIVTMVMKTQKCTCLRRHVEPLYVDCTRYACVYARMEITACHAARLHDSITCHLPCRSPGPASESGRVRQCNLEYHQSNKSKHMSRKMLPRSLWYAGWAFAAEAVSKTL
jgi:hypothetical protein